MEERITEQARSKMTEVHDRTMAELNRIRCHEVLNSDCFDFCVVHFSLCLFT